jgi:hypothetical protein
MPLHIESVTADVTVYDGDLPLSERQLDQLAQHVLRLIARKQRNEHQQREATCISASAQTPHPMRG